MNKMEGDWPSDLFDEVDDLFDEWGWPQGPGTGNPGPDDRFGRNGRYRQAYGNYNGGYSRRGDDFGPPDFAPPPPPFPSGPIMGCGYGPRGPPPPFRFPPGPPRPFERPVPFNRPGPLMGGPIKRPPRFMIEDQALRYLSRCGVAKKDLKGLPTDFLMEIDPKYCGICVMDLDSFQFSRMHYSSKNHLKNQKKWLEQFHGQGNRAGPVNRENPIKSRELYCELCDVQITSIQHADSHYSGKQHRAIVEGRKQPKNTFLLQKGMEGRLKQLIRREKRVLTAGAEKEAAEAAAKPEAKPVPPELQCLICQTFMTNSEQMTQHLNGKRHLTKEKQHILKMMKGEVKSEPPTAMADAPLEFNQAAAAQDVDASAAQDVDASAAQDVDASAAHDVDASANIVDHAGEESQEKQDKTEAEWDNGGEPW